MTPSITSLIQELQQQRLECDMDDDIREGRQLSMYDTYSAFPKIATAYIEQDRKLREAVAALEFYKSSWMNNQHGSLDGSPSHRLLSDKGAKAQEALSSILPINS